MLLQALLLEALQTLQIQISCLYFVMFEMPVMFVFVMFVVNQPNDPNAYLFTTPNFDSLQQCQSSVSDLNQIPIYADKLAREFNGAPTIKSISCSLTNFCTTCSLNM